MARLQHALLAFLAALGFSGCLLFTDPINKAPVVTGIMSPSSPIRGTKVYYTADVVDEDSPAELDLKWATFAPDAGGSCLWIKPADWTSQPSQALKPPQSLKIDAQYELDIESLGVICLCVQATDHHGATGQLCQTIRPVTTLTASITDKSSSAGQSKHPLCSNVHLSAANSTYPAGDDVQFNWNMQYSGTDPAGSTVQLARCAGEASDAEQCFTASVPGYYNVDLTVTDSTVSTPPSPKTSISISVAVNSPACIEVTSPPRDATTVFVAPEGKTFAVVNATDDCEPFSSTSTTLRFVWSISDPQANPSGPAQWVPKLNSSATTFLVNQDLFPNFRPGDTVQVRAEVRDTPTQDNYGPICSQSPSACCTQDTFTCYGADDAGKQNTCVRWTTWNVQFQP